MAEVNSSGLLRGRSDNFLWTLVYLAVAGSGVSGLFTATSTQDRFTGTQFSAEIRSRDVQITNLQQRIEILEKRVEKLPPPHVQEQLRDHEQRLRQGNL